MVDQRFQIFISSTYSDLIQERAAVTESLLRLNCIPTAMELFPASSDSSWQYIQRVIEECDYYVVIVGGRYGSIEAEQGLSYTELEYDFALAKGIPTYGFLPENPGQIISDHRDSLPRQVRALEKFKDKIRNRQVCFYRDPYHLAGLVTLTLVDAFKQNQRPGWIRANIRSGAQAIVNDELRSRVRELEEENFAARTRLEMAKAGRESPQNDPTTIEILRFHLDRWQHGEGLTAARDYQLLAPRELIFMLRSEAYSSDELEAFALMSVCQNTSREQQAWAQRNITNPRAANALAELFIRAHLIGHRAPSLRAACMAAALSQGARTQFASLVRNYVAEEPGGFLDEEQDALDLVEAVEAKPQPLVWSAAVRAGRNLGLNEAEARRAISSWRTEVTAPALL